MSQLRMLERNVEGRGAGRQEPADAHLHAARRLQAVTGLGYRGGSFTGRQLCSLRMKDTFLCLFTAPAPSLPEDLVGAVFFPDDVLLASLESSPLSLIIGRDGCQTQACLSQDSLRSNYLRQNFYLILWEHLNLCPIKVPF